MNPETGGKLAVFCPNDALLKILECPVCLEVPELHIWNCSNGHFICSSCRSKTSNKCVLCRQKYTTSRNFPLEAIIITCRFTCGFEKYGCNQSVSGDSIRHHRENCYYRPMICYLGKTDNCNFTVLNYSNYLEHLVTVHNIFQGKSQKSLKIRQKSTKDSKENYHHWVSMSMTFDNKTFLIRSFKIASNLYWSVGIIGNDVEASKYTASIAIRISDTSLEKHVIETSVQSVRHLRYKFRPDQPHAKLGAEDLKNVAVIKADANKQNTLKIEWQTEYSVGLRLPSV